MIYSNEQFRKKTIEYLEQSWEHTVDGRVIAETFGYSFRYFERKFKESFGIPFALYLKKYKLRQAARFICKQNSLTNVGKRIGFANAQSFSKSFRKEFGISPRAFLYSEEEIPDMPIPGYIYGLALYIAYEDIRTERKIDAGKILASGYYAVFSMDTRGVNDKRILSIAKKELYRYIKEEWTCINHKCTESWDKCVKVKNKECIRVYVPLKKRGQVYKKTSESGSHTWIRYIDEHLTENLTVAKLAKQFNYSLKHFRDTFEMHYGIMPGVYLKKRRLYVAAVKVREKQMLLEEAAKAYGFRSGDHFRSEFLAEFQTGPEHYQGEEYIGEDLIGYYFRHKEHLHVSVAQIPPFFMRGVRAGTAYKRIAGKIDLIESIVKILSKQDGQIVIWQTLEESHEHVCLVGPEIMSEQEANLLEDFFYVDVEGGTYVVIDTSKHGVYESLVEEYRMLYRCAFTGWIWEHGKQVDYRRLTFVRCKEGKLYFYIPVKE